MFLRWVRYRDKSGQVRLSARLLSAHRRGGKVIHKRNIKLKPIIVHPTGMVYGRFGRWDRRDLWGHLDYAIQGSTPRERANIERAFAAVVGPRR
jgi:hypothetical protein